MARSPVLYCLDRSRIMALSLSFASHEPAHHISAHVVSAFSSAMDLSDHTHCQVYKVSDDAKIGSRRPKRSATRL